LNVAGGLRIVEPAADLAAAAALASSALDVPLPQGCVVFGEVSLSGEVRAVGRMEARMKEARKLGFDRALAPAAASEGAPALEVSPVKRLAEAVRRIGELDWGRREAAA
jgi:DNA repair protein RadA/Sms